MPPPTILSLASFLISGHGELRALPVAVDHREHFTVEHFTVHEVAGAPQVARFIAGQLVRDAEVAGGKRTADAGIYASPLVSCRRRRCRALRRAAVGRRRRGLVVLACPRGTGHRASPACRATSCPVRVARSSASPPGWPGWSCWSGRWPSGCRGGWPGLRCA